MNSISKHKIEKATSPHPLSKEREASGAWLKDGDANPKRKPSSHFG